MMEATLGGQSHRQVAKRKIIWRARALFGKGANSRRLRLGLRPQESQLMEKAWRHFRRFRLGLRPQESQLMEKAWHHFCRFRLRLRPQESQLMEKAWHHFRRFRLGLRPQESQLMEKARALVEPGVPLHTSAGVQDNVRLGCLEEIVTIMVALLKYLASV
jgi:hypothetical protein